MPKESSFRYENFNPFVFAEIPSKTRVLDIGCATGLLGRRLREEKGCVVVGIEADATMAEEARKNTDEIILADLEKQIPPSLGAFDVIVCADVLEHLKDPMAVLESLKPHLSDKGFFLISVPNIAFIQTRLDLLFGSFDYNPKGGIMDATHLRFFTMKTLVALLQETDLGIDFVRGYNLVKKRYFFLEPLGRWLPTVFAIQFLAKARAK